MLIRNYSGHVVNTDCCREFGLVHHNTYGYDFYEVMAFGVGKAPGFADEHRWILPHSSYEEASALLNEIWRALRRGDKFLDVDSWERCRWPHIQNKPTKG